MTGLEGNHFRKVRLPNVSRGGIIGHASFFDGLSQWRGYLTGGARDLRAEQTPRLHPPVTPR